MYDKYNLIITKLTDAGIDARKADTLFLEGSGALSLPADASEVISVQPLSKVHNVQSGKDIPTPERYQLLAMARDEERARALLDEAIDDENASPAPALGLPHYRQESSNYVGRLRGFFVYEKIIRVSPNAS